MIVMNNFILNCTNYIKTIKIFIVENQNFLSCWTTKIKNTNNTVIKASENIKRKSFSF